MTTTSYDRNTMPAQPVAPLKSGKSMSDQDIFKPLNEGELNFLRLHNLEVVRSHKWMIVVNLTLRNGQVALTLDRERGFNDWFELLRIHNLPQVP